MERLFRENHQELYPAGHHHTSGEWECQRGLRDLDELKKQQPDPFSAVSAPALVPALSHQHPHLNEKGDRLVVCQQFEASLAGVLSGDEAKDAWAATQASCEGLCKGHFPASFTPPCVSLYWADNLGESVSHTAFPWRSNKQYITPPRVQGPEGFFSPRQVSLFVFKEYITLQEHSCKQEGGREIFLTYAAILNFEGKNTK